MTVIQQSVAAQQPHALPVGPETMLNIPAPDASTSDEVACPSPPDSQAPHLTASERTQLASPLRWYGSTDASPHIARAAPSSKPNTQASQTTKNIVHRPLQMQAPTSTNPVIYQTHACASGYQHKRADLCLMSLSACKNPATRHRALQELPQTSSAQRITAQPPGQTQTKQH